jgi:hypothetical protein
MYDEDLIERLERLERTIRQLYDHLDDIRDDRDTGDSGFEHDERPGEPSDGFEAFLNGHPELDRAGLDAQLAWLQNEFKRRPLLPVLIQLGLAECPEPPEAA